MFSLILSSADNSPYKLVHKLGYSRISVLRKKIWKLNIFFQVSENSGNFAHVYCTVDTYIMQCQYLQNIFEEIA